MARPGVPYCIIIYFVSTILTLTAHIPAVEALLSPPGKVWVAKFEPPYDNRTLSIELAVHDWWTSDQNNAVMNAGTELTVLDGAPWKLPNNVNLTFGPASPQEQHHLVIFLTDTGTRLPVPLGLTETATSGCTAASNAANMSAAHCPATNQDWTLSDPGEDYAVYVMWTARPNGTLAHNGTQPPNFFFGGAELTVTTGSYSAKVSWPNMFFQSSGASDDPRNLNANINFAVETFQSSYLDVISTLTTQYFLLLPLSNPMASGFVVPKSIISSVPQQGLPTELVKQWNACRSSNTNCSAPSGFCTQGLKGILPLTSWLGTTAADVVANSWNALNRGVNKTCYVVGNGEQPYIHADFTVGASHQAQFINCDYLGTYLVPTISLSTNAILQGAISPPPQSPSPSPSITSENPPIPISPPPPVHLPPSGQGQITSPQSTSPTSKPFAGHGIPVSVIITFPDYTETRFNSSGPSDIIAAIQASVIGLTSTPSLRILSITSQPSTVAGGRGLKRSLLSQGASGIVVDAVITFAPADATPASAFVSLLQSSPSTVFPPNTFGNIIVQRAIVLNCIIPCGPHGNPAPSVVGKAVTCTCDCDAGWKTLVNQPFDSFVYCSSPSSAVNGTEQNNGSSSTLAPSEGEY